MAPLGRMSSIGTQYQQYFFVGESYVMSLPLQNGFLKKENELYVLLGLNHGAG